MTTENNAYFSYTGEARMAYADLMQPVTYSKVGNKRIVGKGKDASYACNFIVKDDQHFKALSNTVLELLRLNLPGKKFKVGRLSEEQEAAGDVVEVKLPYFDGTLDADKAKKENKNREMFRGFKVIKARSKFAPVLCLWEKGAPVEYPVDPVTEEQPASMARYFYSGAWGFPTFQLHYYRGDAGKPDGVSLRLQRVLFQKHDTRFGGAGGNAAEVFKGVAGYFTQEDPTGGAAVEELADEEVL